MARKWPKGKVPNGAADRIELMFTRATGIPLSPEEKSQVAGIIGEWTRLNLLALALGVHLTKHDYREFMLLKIGVKG